MTTLTVHRSLARRVLLGDTPYLLIAEDWPTEKQANNAASVACVSVTLGYAPLRPEHLDEDLNALADDVAAQLGIDPGPNGRPYGCSLILEPTK